MKISEIIAWTAIIVLGGLIFSILFSFCFLSWKSSEGNDVRTYQGDIFTPPPGNVTIAHPEPIIGHWIPRYNTTDKTINITIERFGTVTRWKRDNDNFSFMRGPWAKISENNYLIQWQAEVDMHENFAVARSDIPPDETIIYNLSSDSINISNVVYTRYTTVMTNNSIQES
jgi:hypothetical protein